MGGRVPPILGWLTLVRQPVRPNCSCVCVAFLKNFPEYWTKEQSCAILFGEVFYLLNMDRRLSMTVPAPVPSAGESTRAYRFSIARVLCFALCMAALLAFELYCYHTVFDSFHADLVEAEKKSSAWIESQLAFMLPFITICVFQYAVYYKRDGDMTPAAECRIFQLEKTWQIVLLILLIFGVLLPWVAHTSREAHEAALAAALAGGDPVPTTAGGADSTLLMEVHEWFVRLSVPLMLLLLYHACRAGAEGREASDSAARPAVGEAATRTEIRAGMGVQDGGRASVDSHDMTDKSAGTPDKQEEGIHRE